jgi:hypothetical protein
VAREVDLGRVEPVNRPFSADTGPEGDLVVWMDLKDGSGAKGGPGLVICVDRSPDSSISVFSGIGEEINPWACMESMTSMSPLGTISSSV